MPPPQKKSPKAAPAPAATAMLPVLLAPGDEAFIGHEAPTRVGIEVLCGQKLPARRRRFFQGEAARPQLPIYRHEAGPGFSLIAATFEGFLEALTDEPSGATMALG
jgi:hypothetical protein